MHASSFYSMSKFREKYVVEGAIVLDVGGADVNGSYRPLFRGCKYMSLDFENADILVKGYEWPLRDETFDVVITGQVLEHDPFFWVTLKNMARVLKRGGMMCIIVPSAGAPHQHPVDCYRFLADCGPQWGQWMELVLAEQWGGGGGPWHDNVFVYRK